MGGLFSPKVTVPEAKAPTPLPQEDSEATRRAKVRQYAEMSKGTGRESTRLTGGDGEQRLGDYQSAATRGGAVLTG